MRHFATLIVLLLSVACSGHQPKPTPIPQDTDMCGSAEQNLERMQCKDQRGDPMWVNKKGERFQVTCENAQRNAVIFLDPACISQAKSCEEANQCPVF